MIMQEVHNKEEKKGGEQKPELNDTGQKTPETVKENERSVQSEKKINLGDEDRALDSGI